MAVISFSLAAEELKWGASLGYEKIDYGITLENTDAGTSSSDIALPNTVSKGTMSYGALALGIDRSTGSIVFLLKLQVETLMI